MTACALPPSFPVFLNRSGKKVAPSPLLADAQDETPLNQRVSGAWKCIAIGESDRSKEYAFTAQPLSPAQKRRDCEDAIELEEDLAENSQALSDLCQSNVPCQDRDEYDFVLGYPQGRIYYRDLNTSKRLVLEEHQAPIVGVKVYKGRIVSIDLKGILKIWDINTGKCLYTINTKLDFGVVLQVANDRIYLRDKNDLQILKTYELRGMNLPKQFPGFELLSGSINGEKYFLFRDGEIYFWDKSAVLLKDPPSFQMQLALEGGHVSYIYQIEDCLVAVSTKYEDDLRDNTIHVLQPPSKTPILLSMLSKSRITAIEKKEHLLFVATADAEIVVFNLDTQQWVQTCQIPYGKRDGFVNGLRICTKDGVVTGLIVTTTPYEVMYGKLNQASEEEVEAMQQTYFSLEEDKWHEAMESSFHQYGPEVFDKGLHYGAVEPGFMENWQKAANFLGGKFQDQFTADTYLDIHRIALGHFLNGSKGSHITPDRVGKFRGIGNPVHCIFSKPPSPEAKSELRQLNDKMITKFGTSLAEFVLTEDGKWDLQYQEMSQYQVRAIFNSFLNDFEVEMAQAKTSREKLTAIARLYRNSEWLHPVWDGTGRCDLLIRKITGPNA